MVARKKYATDDERKAAIRMCQKKYREKNRDRELKVDALRRIDKRVYDIVRKHANVTAKAKSQISPPPENNLFAFLEETNENPSTITKTYIRMLARSFQHDEHATPEFVSKKKATLHVAYERFTKEEEIVRNEWLEFKALRAREIACFESNIDKAREAEQLWIQAETARRVARYERRNICVLPSTIIAQPLSGTAMQLAVIDDILHGSS
jgi:hypothetical protein